MSNYSGSHQSWLDKDVNLSGRSYRNFMKHNRNKTNVPVEFITLTPGSGDKKIPIDVHGPNDDKFARLKKLANTQTQPKKMSFLSSSRKSSLNGVKPTFNVTMEKPFKQENNILPSKLLNERDSDSSPDISFKQLS